MFGESDFDKQLRLKEEYYNRIYTFFVEYGADPEMRINFLHQHIVHNVREYRIGIIGFNTKYLGDRNRISINTTDPDDILTEKIINLELLNFKAEYQEKLKTENSVA